MNLNKDCARVNDPTHIVLIKSAIVDKNLTVPEARDVLRIARDELYKLSAEVVNLRNQLNDLLSDCVRDEVQKFIDEAKCKCEEMEQAE